MATKVQSGGESDKPAHHHARQGALARSIKEEICL